LQGELKQVDFWVAARLVVQGTDAKPVKLLVVDPAKVAIIGPGEQTLRGCGAQKARRVSIGTFPTERELGTAGEVASIEFQ